MTMRIRLARLKRARPTPKADSLFLDLPEDVLSWITAAQAEGDFPQSQAIGDLLAIVHATDRAKGWVE